MILDIVYSRHVSPSNSLNKWINPFGLIICYEKQGINRNILAESYNQYDITINID